MDKTSEIVPHRITKPIQLLAAWLAGLTIVNASFLTAAGLLHSPSWLPALLTIAAVLNVPIFIVSLFLLQTKFRPEMQEDTYYSQYLERKYSTTSLPSESVDKEKQLARLAEDIVKKVTAELPNKQEQVVHLLKESEIAQMAERFMNSRTLSELHLYFNKWGELVDRWNGDKAFKGDVAALLVAGLIEISEGNVRNAKLTAIGKEVAKRLEIDGQLWNQRFDSKDVERKKVEIKRR